MARQTHPVNSVFDASQGPRPIPADFLEAKPHQSVQANNRPALKNVTNQKVSVVR